MALTALNSDIAFTDPLDGTFWSPVARIPSPIADEEPAESLDRLALRDTLERLTEAEELIAKQQERIEYLESLTMTDELTGLLNRRGFNTNFARALRKARRSGIGGVMVMIDLDGFKGINDIHGHLAGDAYLRQVARILASLVRDHDVVARFGGDEFSILLTETDSATGFARAHEIADAARASSMIWNGKTLPIRFSIGVDPYGPDDREDEVIRKADARMYREKSARRPIVSPRL
jgi:diguanylate cyclase (GGDEF)-like protein